MGAIEDMVKDLPPELRQEVEDFVRFLIEKRKRRGVRKLRMDWAGGLKEFKGKFTALELQKKALTWWGD